MTLAADNPREIQVLVDDAVVRRAALWVDYRPSALAQAGEIVAAVAPGRLTGEALPAIGALLAGLVPGRRDAAQITAYRSLGIVAQDLAAAAHVLGRARAEGRGQAVTV